MSVIMKDPVYDQALTYLDIWSIYLGMLPTQYPLLINCYPTTGALSLSLDTTPS